MVQRPRSGKKLRAEGVVRWHRGDSAGHRAQEAGRGKNVSVCVCVFLLFWSRASSGDRSDLWCLGEGEKVHLSTHET